jgi:hypothetical protein
MTTAATLLMGPMADALKRNREVFNAKFTAAQRAGAKVDQKEFLSFLTKVIDPIVCQIAEHFNEKVDTATAILYELSVDLFSQALLGPGAREPAIADAWQTLLPVVPRLLARDPRRVAASVTNAVHQIGQNNDARPREWIRTMMSVGPLCDDVWTFLEAGKVAGWLSGCPQYRRAALQIVRSLSPAISASLLALDPQTPAPLLHQAIDAMSKSHWLTASMAAHGTDQPTLRVVRRAGGFRGFTGAFLRPPVVAMQGERLMVNDGESVWTLIADAYGCILRRTSGSIFPPGRVVTPMRFPNGGDLDWNTATAKFPEFSGWSSAAFDGQTLAITLSDSHHVFLVSRGGDASNGR